jgi:hypothetical protein
MPGRLAARFPGTMWFAPLAAVVLLSAAAAPGRAQDVLPTTGMDALNAEYKKHHELANDLLRGIRAANSRDSSHVEALDAEAKYATYRFTWVTLQQSAGSIGKVYIDGIDTHVKFLAKGKPATTEAIAIYSAKVTEHAVEVLKSNKVISRVNAAHVLAKLAELGWPDLCDTLVTLLQDPDQMDAVKFYVVRGLRELAAQQPPVLSSERERKAADALAAFIDRKMTIVDTTTREDVEGYRYIRREAVRALAQFRNPGAAAKGQAGMTLLRVMAKDGMLPVPRMDERVDAAVGIARFKSSLDRQYNPDYAIAQLGLFLDDFNREDTAARQIQKDNRYFPILPWKIMSSRLCEAVEMMRANGSDNAYVVKVGAECSKLLDKLERGESADAEDILRIVTTTPPPSGRLYRDVDDSTVKPANRRLGRSEAPFAATLEAKPPVPPAPPAGADGKPGTPPPPPPGAGGKPGTPPPPPPGTKPGTPPPSPFSPPATKSAPPAPAPGDGKSPPPPPK